MSSTDARLALDVAAGWLLGRLVWIAAQELLIKPLLFRLYRQADDVLGGRLPTLP